MICFKNKTTLINAVKEATYHLINNKGDQYDPVYEQLEEKDFDIIATELMLYAED